MVPVTVNPIAKIKDKEVNVCSGNYFKLEINDIIPPGTKFTWSLPTIPSGITGQGAQTLAANFNQTLTNSKLVPITLAYTVTAYTTTSGQQCGSPSISSFPVNVTVNPIATIAQQTVTRCSKDPLLFPLAQYQQEQISLGPLYLL